MTADDTIGSAVRVLRGASRTSVVTIAAEFRLARAAGPRRCRAPDIIETLALPPALKPRICLSVMKHADRHEVVHLVAATQPRRHDVMHAEPIVSAADHAAIAVPSPHRRPGPLPLGAGELGTGGTVTPAHAERATPISAGRAGAST
jgi:hypothetical protein